jgi:hypothetical protein
MEPVKHCFFCLDISKNLILCDVCILEQRMSNYNFQLCYKCHQKHLKFHTQKNTMDKLDIDLYIAKKGNFSDFQ